MKHRRTQTTRRPAERSRRPAKKVIRYAVIGLGHIAQAAVLPAFGHAKRNSRLVALVSGSTKKLKTLGRRYRVPGLCEYGEADSLFRSGEVDAVYIALPNDQHKEWSVRAARAGLHILCEKPMAVTARDCEVMIRAAEAANVKLMIAYRLHFEAANLDAVKQSRRGALGDLKFFSSDFSMPSPALAAASPWMPRTNTRKASKHEFGSGSTTVRADSPNAIRSPPSWTISPNASWIIERLSRPARKASPMSALSRQCIVR
jgi:predicted dehydrogenase